MNPRSKQISDRQHQRRSSEDAELAGVKISDQGRKEDRPQRAVDELDANEDEPYCQCSSNEPVTALVARMRHYYYWHMKRPSAQMACYFRDQALLEAV